jgi:hypothetical protein
MLIKIFKLSLLFLALSFSLKVFAYTANCQTQDGKQFMISVQNKIMTIDNKYTASYKGRDGDGFYTYSNRGYTYKAGKIERGVMPIKVTNKWGLDTSGYCKLTG